MSQDQITPYNLFIATGAICGHSDSGWEAVVIVPKEKQEDFIAMFPESDTIQQGKTYLSVQQIERAAILKYEDNFVGYYSEDDAKKT